MQWRTRSAGLALAGLFTLASCNLAPTAAPADPTRTPTTSATHTTAKRVRSAARHSADGSIPIKVISGTDGTLVLVPVRVDGQGPYEFLLDTGSSTSSVNKSLQHRLNLPTTGAVQRVQGVAGGSTVPVVSIHRWSIGGMSLPAADVAVITLDTNATGLTVSGLLGSDELSKFGTVTIDFRHQLLIVGH